MRGERRCGKPSLQSKGLSDGSSHRDTTAPISINLTTIPVYFMENLLYVLPFLLLPLTACLIVLEKVVGAPSWRNVSRLDKPIMYAYVLVAVGWLFVGGAMIDQSIVLGVSALVGSVGHLVAAVYCRKIMLDGSAVR